eukprot:11330597-Heterocapsa_arctica.AAC.1
MPAGYTVCMACHVPFFFDTIMGVAQRRIFVPAMAAKVVVPGTLSTNDSPKKLKEFSSKQIAKAVQGSR